MISVIKMAVSKVLISCIMIGILSSKVSSRPTRRLIHLSAKQRPPITSNSSQAFLRPYSNRKRDKYDPTITCRNCGETKNTSLIYHLPKHLELHDTFDIIMKSKNHSKPASISLMTENNKTACTLIIKSDDQQTESGQLKRDNKVIMDKGQPSIEINLDEFLQDSYLKVSFTVRKNEHKGETNTLEIGGKNGYIDPIEIHEDIRMGDIKYLKIDGHELEVAELKFTFDLLKGP